MIQPSFTTLRSEEIIRILDTAPAVHPYKGRSKNLRDINEYSRGDSHAAVAGNPSEETTDEELRVLP